MIFDVFEKCQKHDTKCKLDTNRAKNMTLNKNMTLIVNMTLIAETTVARLSFEIIDDFCFQE